MVNFGGLIKKARKEKKITIREAAELVNISYPYFSQLENNKNFTPSKSILLRLSFVLGIKYSHLVHFSNTKITDEFSEEIYSLSKFLPIDVFNHLNGYEESFLPYLQKFFKNDLPVPGTPMDAFKKNDKPLIPGTDAILIFPFETIEHEARELFNLFLFYNAQERDLFILYLQELVNDGKYERAKEMAIAYNTELNNLLSELDELINNNASNETHVESLKNHRLKISTHLDSIDSILKSIKNRGIASRLDSKIYSGSYNEGEIIESKADSSQVATLGRSINDRLSTGFGFTQINLESVLNSDSKISYKEKLLSKTDKEKLLKLLDLYFT